MHATRLRMLARRVMYTDKVEKASPPRRSLRFVWTWGWGLGGTLGCDCCGGWDEGSDGAFGGGVLGEEFDDEVCDWAGVLFSGVVALESALELGLEPQPK